MLAGLIRDARLLDLACTIIDAGPPGSPPGLGLPIGNLTSQHFANLYLGALDHHALERLQVSRYVRYMDDVLVFGEERADLWRIHAGMEAYLAEPLKLLLRSEVTRVAPVGEGIPFLGFRIFPRCVRLDPEGVRRFRRKVRAIERMRLEGTLSDDDAARRVASLVGHAASFGNRGLSRALWERLDSRSLP